MDDDESPAFNYGFGLGIWQYLRTYHKPWEKAEINSKLKVTYIYCCGISLGDISEARGYSSSERGRPHPYPKFSDWLSVILN